MLRRLARHAFEPLEHRRGPAEGLRPVGGDERHALGGKLRGLLRPARPGARARRPATKSAIGATGSPAGRILSTATSPPPRSRCVRSASASRPLPSKRTTRSPGRSLRARACAASSSESLAVSPAQGSGETTRRARGKRMPIPLPRGGRKEPSAANAGAPSRAPPGRAVFPRERAGLPEATRLITAPRIGRNSSGSRFARTRGKTPATASTAAARSDTREPNGWSRRFSRATKTASRVRVQRDRAARPESRRGERQDTGPGADVEDLQAVRGLFLQAEERETRGLVAARAEGRGGRQPQGDPSGRRARVGGISRVDPESFADGEGARGRAEILERIPFRNVRDQVAADAGIRQRPARPPRRFRLAKAGDEVAALLDEAERAMEPHESEDGVVLRLARDEEPRVLQPGHRSRESKVVRS